MEPDGIEEESASEVEELGTTRKLDLGYFTTPPRCPLMVRRGARGAFELFLYLADRFLENNGQPVVADHKALCRACGLDPQAPHSRSAVSRLLGSLRTGFGVMEYEPGKRHRPQIRLARLCPVFPLELADVDTRVGCPELRLHTLPAVEIGCVPMLKEKWCSDGSAI